MPSQIIMHITYCEQGQSIPDICRKAVKLGFDGVEFRYKRTGIAETPQAYLDAINKAVAQTGLKKVLFGGGPTSREELDRQIDEVIRFYELATQRFQLTVCNLFSAPMMNPDKSVSYAEYHKHGSAVATEQDWASHVVAYKKLGAAVEALGLRLAFETHPCYLHDLPSVTRKLVDLIASPAIGINLDFANYLAMDTTANLKETLTAMGDKLFYVHFKNMLVLPNGKFVRTGLSDGQINYREFLRLLKEANYTAPIALEAPRPGDREWFAQQDIVYLKALLADLA